MENRDLVEGRISRLVAAEVDGDGMATLYCRGEDGTITSRREPFCPWVLVAFPDLVASLQTPHEVIPLEGEGKYRWRVLFPNVKSYEAGLKELRELSGVSASSLNAPYRVFSDLTQQFLMMCPARLFQGMRFEELRRLQLDIETRTEGEPHFPDAKRRGDCILMISLKDSSGFEQCLVNHGDEKALLQEFVKVFCERDADVIEGHNIYNFDLPYIRERCRLHKVPFTLGRDGSIPKVRSSRLSFGERTLNFTRFDIYGRHIIDTYHLVQLYDISHRDMESHGLKAAAKYFHVAVPNRTYVDGEEITKMFDTHPETLMDYCLDDVRETDSLSRILSPSYFYQTTLIPYGYQSVVTRGNATRIDALLCGEYLRENCALPVPEMPQPVQGALTEGERQGVFQNVWHVDVRSLYPSIIVSRGLTPSRDVRGVFLRLLEGLRQFRLAAKDARKKADTQEKRDYYDALQATFKILINSFYGYTAFAQGTFNDYRMAAEITSTGREILAGMREFLESSGAVIIEMDTDGIYFTPPAGETEPEHLLARIQEVLPQGIEVELDAVYKAMFGYKSKNYALLHTDGSVTMTGAALKSRGLEPFQRRFIRDVITLKLTGREAEVPALYEKTIADLEEHRLPLSDFAQKEVLSTDPAAYAAKVVAGTAKKSAAYDLAIGSSKTYKMGDTVEFYVTGTKKTVSVTGNSKLLSDADPNLRDENVPYYLAKLQSLMSKLNG